MNRRVLVTNFPGPRSELFVRQLLETDPELRVELLVASAEVERAAAILEPWPAAARERVSLLDAEPAAIDFGLSGREYRDLAERVTHIAHLQLSLEVPERGGLEERVIGGTREVLELSRVAPALRAVLLQSSVFVSGDRAGLVRGAELRRGQSFRSAWEELLARCELMAEAALGKLPLVVARVSNWIGGGPVSALDPWSGPQLLLEALAASSPEFRVPLPLPADGYVHLLPVDVGMRALVGLLLNPDARGRTVHLTMREAPSFRRFVERSAEVHERACGADAPTARVLRALASQLDVTATRWNADWLCSRADYDVSEAEQLLGGWSCPNFDHELERVRAARLASGAAPGTTVVVAES